MRKNAGFIIMTLLLLTVPALANAWTLVVKVSGASAANYVTTSFTLADGTVSTRKFEGNGTSYIYPTSRVKVAYTGTKPTSLDFAGFSQYSSVNTLVNQTLTVNYASTVSYQDLSISQASGGSAYAQNLNNTWSATGVTQAPTGTIVNVAIAADANHKILGYHIGSGPVITPASVTGAAGQVITVPITLSSTETITPDFGVAGRISASLFAPSGAVTGTAFNVTVTATSNDTGLLYSYSADSGANFSAPSAASSHSFLLPAGTYGLMAKVTSANGGSFTTPVASIVIADATVDQNQGCTSCHSTQSPTVVAGGPTFHKCTTCHTSAPHDPGAGLAPSGFTPGVHLVNPVTFQTLTTSVKGLAKGKIFCTACHSTIPHQTTVDGTVAGASLACNACHTSDTGVGGAGDVHSMKELSCVGCHSVAQNAASQFTNLTLVNDNAGVRAVTGEFSKWSHHIVNAPGVAIVNEQCGVCHLEGTVGKYGFGVDGTKHMIDSVTHLRNADTDGDLQWDPANPNHSTMDTFCMSCHDANGATSPMNLKLQALITPLTGTTATPSNPFGDTISNQYDKMMRPAVVNVNDQFNTGNNSHHGVKGPRYSGRTRVAGSRQIASTTAFTANSSANLPGKRTTIFDAGKFNALYVPLVNAGGEAAPRTGAASLGDDSTLHCGDCHTVGQWKAGSTVNAAGVANTVAIGAHGSNNEYMLRNSIGTDARHQGIPFNASGKLALDTVTPLLVCYNCHNVANYGLAAHVGEQVSENNCNFVTNTNTVNTIGSARLMSQFPTTIGTYVAGANSGADYSNIFGIQCNNCHNSGISAGNIFGGIHGSVDPTYKDGAGNTTKHERFLPGLGNVMYVPGTRGGVTGGTTAYVSYSSAVQKTGISTGLRFKGSYGYTTGGVTLDTNWEEKSRIPVGDGVTGWSHNPGAAGCYTITAGDDEPYSAEGNGVPGGPAASKGLTAPDGTLLFGNWGGCDDHSQSAGSSVRQPRSGNTSIRPVTY